MKPIELVARAIVNSSHKGDLVLDLFGGSGSTLIAAEQTDRLCHTMELDVKYVDVIVKRMALLLAKIAALRLRALPKNLRLCSQHLVDS